MMSDDDRNEALALLRAMTDQDMIELAAAVAAELDQRNMAPVGPFADLVRSMRDKQKAFYKSSGGGRDLILREAKWLEQQVDRVLAGPPAVDPQIGMGDL